MLKYLYLFGRIEQPHPKHYDPSIHPVFFINGLTKPQITLNKDNLESNNRHISFNIDIFDKKNNYLQYIAQEIFIIFIEKTKFDNKLNKNNLNLNINQNNGFGSGWSFGNTSFGQTTNNININNINNINNRDIDDKIDEIIEEFKNEYNKNINKIIFGHQIDRKNAYNNTNFTFWEHPNTINLETINNYNINNIDSIDGLQIVLHKDIKSKSKQFDILLSNNQINNLINITNSYYLCIKASVLEPFEINNPSKWPKTHFSRTLININKEKYTYEKEWENEGLITTFNQYYSQISQNNQNNQTSQNSQNSEKKETEFDCKIIKLDLKHEDYQMVSEEFYSSCKKTEYIIISIYKVINPIIEQLYFQFKKSTLLKLNNDISKLNEMSLWHGTKLDTIMDIIHQGFLQAFSSRQAFGNGCYFATKSKYSSNSSYSVPDNDGIQHMLNCSVVCGEYITGRQDMIAPPNKPNKRIRYESTVDNTINPQIIITHSDNQAIPKFIVSFKRK